MRPRPSKRRPLRVWRVSSASGPIPSRRARRSTWWRPCVGRSDGFGAWATAGLHPHDASGGPVALQAVEERHRLGRRPSTRESSSRWGSAVSTITTTTRRATEQRQAFEAQIALAAELGSDARRPHESGLGRHDRHSPVERHARAGGHPLLHRWPAEARALSRSRRVPFVQRHRHLQRGTRGARGGGPVPGRTPARGDRRAVPRSGSVPGQAQPSGLGGGRRGGGGRGTSDEDPADLAESSSEACTRRPSGSTSGSPATARRR